MSWPEFFLGLFVGVLVGVLISAGAVIFCLDRFGAPLEGEE